MLVRCQRFGDWFLFGLVWQYSSIQKNIIKVGAKSWMLTCSCHITLSLPFYTDPDSKRELNFCNGYLSLLYFCLQLQKRILLHIWFHSILLYPFFCTNCAAQCTTKCKTFVWSSRKFKNTIGTLNCWKSAVNFPEQTWKPWKKNPLNFEI